MASPDPGVRSRRVAYPARAVAYRCRPPRVLRPCVADMRLNGTARKALVVLLLAVVLIPFGVPRFLNSDDDSPAGAGDDARFAQLCREHGGKPQITSGTGAISGSQRFCRVRYGRHVYLMDAITPGGFDADT